LDQILRYINPDDGWTVEILALFLIPYVHEDVAIIGAALLIVEHGMPIHSAALSLYAGIVASDIFLYGLGVLARHNSWAQRLLLKPRVSEVAGWLTNHLPPLMVVARIVPGVMFPAYISLGFCGVSFIRFTAITMLTALIYLPVVLFLVANLGQEVLTHLGYWSWILVIAILTVAVWNLGQKPRWQTLFRSAEFGLGAIFRHPITKAEKPDLLTHGGMPSLAVLSTKISLAERIPMAIFYIPLVIQWIWLGLKHRGMSVPALANPNIESGGLWGESKSAYLQTASPDQKKWFADFTTFRRASKLENVVSDQERAREAIAASGLSFPLVAKPDIGWRGFGVRLVADGTELDRYIEQFPEGETILFQRPVDWDGEAGVLYMRLPGETEGRIFSLTFRYFPHVVGNGKSSLRELIVHDQRAVWKIGAHFGLVKDHLGTVAEKLNEVPANDEVVRLSFIGSIRVGGLYRDAREHITPAMIRRFDEISKSIPEFFYGRYDVRFRSVESLEEGEDFQIIEINGAGAESINVWDPQMPLKQVYKELFEQQRLIFEIGARNRDRGFKPPGLLSIAKSQWRQHRLIVHYPPSS
jgi:membrane protein DedA with SNARE-associated domain